MEIVFIPTTGKKANLKSSKKCVSNKLETLLNDPNNLIPENIFDKKTHSIFSKKSDALNYISESNNKELKLFCEDICENNGSKRFIVSTIDNIYYLSKTKNKHMYECYEHDQ
jgi:hypothetical protein